MKFSLLWKNRTRFFVTSMKINMNTQLCYAIRCVYVLCGSFSFLRVSVCFVRIFRIRVGEYKTKTHASVGIPFRRSSTHTISEWAHSPFLPHFHFRLFSQHVCLYVCMRVRRLDVLAPILGIIYSKCKHTSRG